MPHSWDPHGPLSGWHHLRAYRPEWIRGDVLAGITVAAYLIPQCMAYGELAGVDPIRGLWAILPAMLLYALLGSSPQLSVGPESTTAVMTATAIAPIAGGDALLTPVLCSLLALLVGLVCCIGAWFRLGFLADLLSKPILIGYLAGVALIMIISQIGRFCGIPLEAESFPAQLGELVSRIDQLHVPTLLLGSAVLLFLLILGRCRPSAPGPLLAVLLATAVVTLFHLESRGIAVIGAIPAGLPRPTLPTDVPTEHLRGLVASAIGIAVVGYSDNVLTARSFAARNGYRIDANREWLALGSVNLANGLLQGFPVSSSGSRTAIGDSLGSRSQLFSLVALAVVVLVLLFFRPLLASFPTVALAAIVIHAALRLIDLDGFRTLQRFRGSEFRLALATTGGVLLTDILVGVALAVTLSVIDLFARIVRPNDAVLGEVPQLAGYHDVRDWQGARTRPGLLIYRYDAPLCFANAEHFHRRALEAIAAESTPVQWFVLNAEAITEIDSTAADAIADLCRELRQRNIHLLLARVKQDLYVLLERAGLVELIGPGHFLPTLSTAIAAFERRAEREDGGEAGISSGA